MTVLVQPIPSFPSEAAGDASKGGFYRAPSSPAARSYLNEVLRSLLQLPASLSRNALQTLADDKKLSVKWRPRLEEAAWRLDG